MQARRFRRIPVPLAFLLITAFRLSAGAGPGEAEPAAFTGVIVYLEGEVLLDGAAAEIGQEVEAGATLATGPAALCELIFGERNICRFEENTTAVLDLTGARGSIRIRSGSLAAVFSGLRTLGARGEAFTLTTPTMVAGVRGTAFYIRVEDPASTYVCTCNGTLTQRKPDRRAVNRVTADNHAAFRFSREPGKVRRRRAGLLYHDNALMEELAAAVGTRLVWGREGGY
jgi:hypothetical protein